MRGGCGGMEWDGVGLGGIRWRGGGMGWDGWKGWDGVEWGEARLGWDGIQLLVSTGAAYLSAESLSVLVAALLLSFVAQSRGVRAVYLYTTAAKARCLINLAHCCVISSQSPPPPLLATSLCELHRRLPAVWCFCCAPPMVCWVRSSFSSATCAPLLPARFGWF